MSSPHGLRVGVNPRSNYMHLVIWEILCSDWIGARVVYNLFASVRGLAGTQVFRIDQGKRRDEWRTAFDRETPVTERGKYRYSFSDSLEIIATSPILMLWSVLLNNYCITVVAGIMVGSRDCYCLCLAGITVFTDVLLTNSYHYFIFYILLCLILSFISYNRIAAGGSLTLAYLHPLNTTNERGKLERSGKRKINFTSKSCRCFLN